MAFYIRYSNCPFFLHVLDSIYIRSPLYKMITPNISFALVALLANTALALPAIGRRDTATAGAIAEIAGIAPPPGGNPPTQSVSTTQTAVIQTTPTPSTTTGTITRPSSEPQGEGKDSGSQAPAPAQPGLTLYQKLALAPNAVARQALLKDEDMIFKFDNPLQKEGLATGEGGSIVRADHATFPALVGQGGSLAIGFLGPCGFNTPHVHPRAAELNLVIEGHLFANVVNENGARFINHTLGKYEMTVFPQGAVHTEFNPDCTPSVFVAAFPHEDVSIPRSILYVKEANILTLHFSLELDKSLKSTSVLRMRSSRAH